MSGAEVGPLTQIRFSKDDGARRAQSLDDGGIARGLGAEQRERAGGRVHAIGRVEIIFDQHRHTVERTAHVTGAAFAIERVGDGQRFGVDLDDRVHCRAFLIERIDAREIPLNNGSSRKPIFAEAAFEIGECGFFEIRGSCAEGARGRNREKSVAKKAAAVHEADYKSFQKRTMTLSGYRSAAAMKIALVSHWHSGAPVSKTATVRK